MRSAGGLDVVHTFIVLAEELNFRACADRLNVDQSAVTRRIQKLEQFLGVRLLDRTTRSVRLTRAGRAFYSDNIQLVSEYDASVRRTQRIAEGKTGALRIVYMTLAAAWTLPAHVARFQALRPDVHITLTYMRSAMQKQSLATAEADIGYVLGRFDHPEFHTLALADEPLFVVAHAEHWLMQEKVPLLQALAGHKLVSGDGAEWGDYNDYIDGLLGEEGLRIERAFETANIQAQLGLIAAGLGIGILPLGLARSLPRHLRARQIPNERFTVAQTMTWSASNPNEFIADFVQCASQ